MDGFSKKAFMEQESQSEFEKLLNAEHRWPCDFVFKFVIPLDKRAELTELFPDQKFSETPSSGGKYIAFTMVSKMNSSEEVLRVYHRASRIQGLIAL